MGGLRLAAVVVAAEAAEGGVCVWADLPELGDECVGALPEASWRLAEIAPRGGAEVGECWPEWPGPGSVIAERSPSRGEHGVPAMEETCHWNESDRAGVSRYLEALDDEEHHLAQAHNLLDTAARNVEGMNVLRWRPGRSPRLILV